MRILITGGAGFIGSHLAERLDLGGHEVTVYDDLSSGNREHLAACSRRCLFVHGDVLDADAVTRLTAEHDRVVHLAATVGVDQVARRPARAERVIRDGSALVLNAAARHGVPAVFASSSEVYGFAAKVPAREDDVVACIEGDAPRLAYARAKLEADRGARALHASGHAILTVRPFNVVGPRQSHEHGAVLPRFVRRALEGAALEVHGGGAQRRTFLDVRDAADALARLVERDHAPFDAVNLGGVEEWSMADLAACVARRIGGGVSIRAVEHAPERGGVEVARRVPDLSRLRAILPEFAPGPAVERAIDVLAGATAVPAAAR